MKQHKHNKHIGSSLDDFLAEEGILEEVEEVAAKRVFVFQLEKANLADRMETSRSAIERKIQCP